MLKAYKGQIMFTESPEKFTIYENGYIVVEDGFVKSVGTELPELYKTCDVTDFGDRIIVPGFVDLHFHAPQFPNLGLGLDKELLPWLEEYTFPEEAKFKDLDYANKVYRRVARDIWRQGTTRVVLLSSLHKEGSKLLMDIFGEAGLGAYIGKVNMDRNSPDFLIEETAQSLQDTEDILKTYGNKYELVKPIITPRFVPTCTSELMNGLSGLAKQYGVSIQSHISENTGECEWVKALHPECKDYASVYKAHGLMTSKTVMAHCVHNTDEEIDIFKETGTFAAHCPNANYNLSSGIMPVRKFMNAGVNVGLGTDVGAGHKISISSVMSTAIQSSKIAWLNSNKALDPLTTSEAFYLGTKGGGAFFGKVGSFEENYEFDALVINDEDLGEKDGRSLEERLQRFIYIGDDRQIEKRFVKGNLISEPKL